MNQRLRTVFVDHVARLSGAEIALIRLVPALLEHADVHVILGENGPLVERLRAAGSGVEVLPLDPRIRDIRKESVRLSSLGLRPLFPLQSYVWRLARRLLALDVDVVHTNSLKAAFYGGVAGRLAELPVIWHIRDRIAADYMPPPAVRLVRLASRMIPTAVVANSRATLETLPFSVRTRVLYNAVVPDFVVGAPAGNPLKETPFTVGIVGRLAPWKGQRVFLEAFAAAFRGSDVLGRVIGSAMFGEDDYAQGLEELVTELGIAGQVEFRGFRDDIWRELAELDVLVHASTAPEPFGQVILEGMAARLAVVATDAGGPAELITDGLDGVLTPPGDVAALSHALRRLHRDGVLRRRLGSAAFERSREFTPDRTARQVLDVYSEVLRTRR